ncbi:MAG TPA: zf-HC2 domain-containing protein [Blastocatellia bacterium]|nr:zf-HC2 domain-containing protein [Blastocatellia bacterium]
MSNRKENCGMHEALVSYLYNEAASDERGRVEAHLADCPSCKQELAAFEQVRGMLQQWQIDEMPVVRVVTEPRRSPLALLRELFDVTPIWAKAVGALAMAMLVLAALGTEVSIGRGGVSARVDLLRRGGDISPATPLIGASVDDPMAAVNHEQLRALVDSIVVDSDRRQREELNAQLVGLESQLSKMRSSELMKLAQRIQEHQARLKTIERDIDRREGLDLTDILFSGLTTRPVGARQASEGGD